MITVLNLPIFHSSEPSTLSSEETVHGLKAELERCLANYRNKRQQLSSTQEELRITKTSLDSAQRRLGAAEVEAKEAKVRRTRNTWDMSVNSLTPGRYGSNFKSVILKQMLQIMFMSTSWNCSQVNATECLWW